MPLFILLALALVQGLTEFLPVSSSGHLVMLSTLFSLPQNDNLILYYVLVHAGTASAAVFFFRKDIRRILLGLWDALNKKQSLRAAYALKWTGLIAAISLPTGIAGILLKDYAENISFAYLVPFGLLLTAILLLLTQRTRAAHWGLGKFNYGAAFIVGLAQSCALMPGLSRSGSTIAAALLLGARPNFAGRLSFLASLVAIFGALALEIAGVAKAGVLPPANYAWGFIAAFTVGLFSLRFLMMILNTRKLHYFAYYCLTVGVFYTAYLAVRG